MKILSLLIDRSVPTGPDMYQTKVDAQTTSRDLLESVKLPDCELCREGSSARFGLDELLYDQVVSGDRLLVVTRVPTARPDNRSKMTGVIDEDDVVSRARRALM